MGDKKIHSPRSFHKRKVFLDKNNLGKLPSHKLIKDRDIAMDFAQNVYKKFDKLVKSVVFFGSGANKLSVEGSDLDIVIFVDDASVRFDPQFVSWYREELAGIITKNPYNRDLHINTIKLTTWWDDLTRGDPVAINILRYGEALIDFGGFFNPLKILLDQGRIRPTPEAISTCLSRVPVHILRSKQAELSSIEGCYWAMVDSSQALLMSIKLTPPSPDHIALMLKENFVDKRLMKLSYVTDFKELYDLHKKIMHGEIKDLRGDIIDSWQKKSEDYFNVVMKLIKTIIS